MRHVVMIGACYLDNILSVPHFPEEDSKLRATDFESRRGGNCPNSLEVLQQLVTDDDGVCLHLVTCLPDKASTSTRRIIESFGPHSSIEFSKCLYREGSDVGASSYIIKSGSSDSRTIVNYNPLHEMTVQEFSGIIDSFAGDSETWWHFEGRIPDITLACIRLLRKKLPPARISVEIEKPGREGLIQLATEADVVFYSRTWAENRGYKSAEECLKGEQRRKGSLGLCTWGADGATAMLQPSSECITCPVPGGSEGVKVMDPVGAGDTFVAGMLRGLVCDDALHGDVRAATMFAVRLASLKVQREGFAGLGRDMALG